MFVNNFDSTSKSSQHHSKPPNTTSPVCSVSCTNHPILYYNQSDEIEPASMSNTTYSQSINRGNSRNVTLLPNDEGSGTAIGNVYFSVAAPNGNHTYTNKIVSTNMACNCNLNLNNNNNNGNACVCNSSNNVGSLAKNQCISPNSGRKQIQTIAGSQKETLMMTSTATSFFQTGNGTSNAANENENCQNTSVCIMNLQGNGNSSHCGETNNQHLQYYNPKHQISDNLTATEALSLSSTTITTATITESNSNTIPLLQHSKMPAQLHTSSSASSNSSGSHEICRVSKKT